MSRIYAIDFGTSNSLLSAACDGATESPVPLEPEADDPTILRSILYTPQKTHWFFGGSAIDEYTKHMAEGRLFRSIKKYLPDDSFSGTTIHGKHYKLQDLIAVFLREMRERANRHFQDDVTGVVMGRPAAFSTDPEKDQLAENRLRAAANQAGFKDVEFCPEPVAAAYEFRHTLDKPQMTLIADFGGGTSDFTVLRMSRDSFDRNDVLAVGGISVAGDMFDGSIMKHMISPHFGTRVVYKLPMGSVDLKLPKHLINRMCHPADISFLAQRDIRGLLRDAQRWSLNEEDQLRMERLFTLVDEHLGYKLFSNIEDVKKTLSSETSARFSFDYPGIDVEEDIYSADFRVCSVDQVEKITKSLDETMKQAGVGYDEIDIVCCTGGTARIPALFHELARRVGEDKLRQHRHFHSVIGGLAERAAAMA